MKILIAGGGTGGHIYPVVSIAKTFIKNGVEVVLVGRKNSKEENIYKAHKLCTRTIESAALEFSPKKFSKFVHKASIGIKEAYRTLREENIDAVSSLSGGILFNEIMPATSGTNFWLEIKNNENVGIHLSGYRIRCSSAVTDYIFPSETIPAGGFKIITNDAIAKYGIGFLTINSIPIVIGYKNIM